MKTLAFVVMVGASVMCWGKNKPDGQDLRQQLQTAEGRCIRWAERIEKDAGGLGVAVPDAVGEARKGLDEYRRAPEWVGLRSRTTRTATEAVRYKGDKLSEVDEPEMRRLTNRVQKLIAEIIADRKKSPSDFEGIEVMEPKQYRYDYHNHTPETLQVKWMKNKKITDATVKELRSLVPPAQGSRAA